VGYASYVELRGDGNDDRALALVVVLAMSALLALLVLPRWSPLGTAFVGVVYLGLTIWSLFGFNSFRDVMPETWGVDQLLVATGYPVLGLLSVPLLATVFSTRRWRQHADRQPASEPPGYPNQPGYPGGGFPPPSEPGFPPPSGYQPGAFGGPPGSPAAPPYGTPGSPVAPGYPGRDDPYSSDHDTRRL